MIERALDVDPVTRIVVVSLRDVAGVARGERTARVLPGEVDVHELFARALSLGLVASVSTAYAADPAMADARLPFGQYQVVAEHVFRLQVDCWRDVASLLEDEGVPSLLLKGAFVFGTLWTGPLRLMADVDLLVPRRATERVRHVLTAILDYQHGHDPASEAGHYELGIFYKTVAVDKLAPYRSFVREHRLSDRENRLADREPGALGMFSRPGVEELETLWWDVEFDLHHNVVQPAVAEAELWADPVTIDFGGREAETVRPELTAWLLATRCMIELGKRERAAARMLHDLAVLCSTVVLDYDEVDRLSRRYGTDDMCYSVFRFLRDDIAVSVPAAFVTGLERRSRGRPQHVDLVPLLFSKPVPTERGPRVVYRWAAPA